jgi:hypothetical protein
MHFPEKFKVITKNSKHYYVFHYMSPFFNKAEKINICQKDVWKIQGKLKELSHMVSIIRCVLEHLIFPTFSVELDLMIA